MSKWLKDTISASELINLINPNHPTGNSEAAKLGKIEHNKVLEQIKSNVIPQQLKRVSIDFPVNTQTKPSCLEIDNGLWMSVIPDLCTKSQIFELKPGARELRYYAMQLAIGCMIKDFSEGVLFFYKDEHVYRLENGARQCWKVFKTMGIQARMIYDIQTRIDELKLTPVNHQLIARNTFTFETTADWGENHYQEKMRLGFESCEIRKCFDINTNIVFSSLRTSLKSLN